MTKSREMPGQPPVDQAAAHPSAEAVTEFWSSILEQPVELRGGAWLDNLERDCEEIQQQDRVILQLEDLRDILKKSNNWKAPGRDKIHAFWWRKFSSIHERLVVSFQSATEGLLLAVQDQAIATRHYQVTVIGRGDVVDICRVCGTRGETVDHIVACCPALAKTLYIERHDTLVKLVHDWALKVYASGMVWVGREATR